MSQYPPIAIVIPTLNEERFIARCLQSVQEQSYPMEQMDIMVVDGGSTDRTRDIVLSLSQTIPQLRLLDNPRKIQSIAFNIGVAASTAPYIIRLDAHATYHTDYIRLCVEHLQAHPEYGNVGGVWDIQAQHAGLMAEANALLNQSCFGIGGAGFRVGAAAGETDTVPFGAFPRTVIEHIGGMREDLARGEDNEFNSRIRKARYKIYLDPAIIATYYARDTLLGSMRQMYANGESIASLMYIDRQSLGLRHLVPMLFVIAIIGGLILGAICRPLFWLLLTMLTLYVLCALLAAADVARQHGLRFFFVLPIMFLLIHLSYGWGTLVGLILYRKQS